MSSVNKQIEFTQHKSDFTKESFYSFLNDTAIDCNTFCGKDNTTCFNNCVVKNKALIETMRDYVLYSQPRETVNL